MKMSATFTRLHWRVWSSASSLVLGPLGKGFSPFGTRRLRGKLLYIFRVTGISPFFPEACSLASSVSQIKWRGDVRPED